MSSPFNANNLLILPMVKLKADMHEAATMLNMPFKEYLVKNVAGPPRWYDGPSGWSVLFTYNFHPRHIAYVTSHEGALPRAPWTLRVTYNFMTINETHTEAQINMTEEQLVIELARFVHPSLKQSFNQPEKANEL